MGSASHHELRWQDTPEGLVPAHFEPRLRFLLARLRALQSSRGPAAAAVRALDVGCGEGDFAAELARAGAEVIGVDVAHEPLRRARARYPQLDLRALPVEGEWPLPDAHFELVWAGETIEHVADTAGWLSEIRRVLRSGGVLLLSTPAHGRLRLLRLALSARAFAKHFDPRSDHLRFYTARTLRGLLTDFGFEQIEVRAAVGPPGARRLLFASARRARYG
jgi:2-polyprenyl-3-methyl-5-hydroxy-6-metoxy-1,4-benzoquinol methylase